MMDPSTTTISTRKCELGLCGVSDTKGTYYSSYLSRVQYIPLSITI